MTTTLDALTSGGSVAVQFVVAIEGYGYLLTNGSPSAAVTAWSGTDWTAALGGLQIKWGQQQKIHPWEPFAANSSTISLLVQDADGTDRLGVDVFNREGGTSTRLDGNATPAATDIDVVSTSGFAAQPNYVYIGPEAVLYSDPPGAASFGGCTRGYWSPATTQGGARFARYHRAVSTLEGPDPLAVPSTQVRDKPTTWRGRWCYVYIHRVVGGVLDVKAQAHLAFAGRVATVADMEDGRTQIAVEDVRSVLRDTVVMREQWRARLRPLVYVREADEFTAYDERTAGGVTTIGGANRLRAVTGAAGVNQIEPGLYAPSDVASKVNDWLAAEKTAARLLFHHVFTYDGRDAEGNSRSQLAVSDPTTTSASRSTRVRCNNASLRAAFGWDGDGIGGSMGASYRKTFYSAREPSTTPIPSGPNSRKLLGFESERGAFVSQSTLAPPEFSEPNFVAVGAVRIGNHVFPCKAPNGAAPGVIQIGAPVNSIVGLDAEDPSWEQMGISEGGEIEIAQVLVTQAKFSDLVMHYLCSTGSALYNGTQDLLADHVGAAIPYDLISHVDADIARCPGGDDVMTVIVDKPTRLADLFSSSFVLRGVQFVWRQGELRLKALSTPTSTASIALTNATKYAPADTDDALRSVSEESDELLRNTITIKHNGSPLTDEYRDTTTLVDPSSCLANGSRALTVTARNAVRGSGQAGEDLEALLPLFASSMSLLGRPLMKIRVPIGFSEFETHTAGEAVLISDPFVRDPLTGTRSLAARPGFIASDWHDWGAGVGEVEVLVFPGLTVAPYSPCAEVDATATNAGYIVATKVLTCYAHKHSAASDVADATRFPVGSKIRVVEIDPAAAGAPQTWLDTVAAQSGNTITVTTGLASWNSAKLYRVISDDYAAATTLQRTDTYQADDADGVVKDLRAPYSLAHFGAGQTSSFSAVTATTLPARPPTLAYGDGAPLDTGHAFDLATAINSLVSYKTAIQTPEVLDVASWSSGTWWLVYCAPVFLGVGRPSVVRSRKLYVSPTIYKSGGVSSSVRVTLSASPPTSADPANPSRADVTRWGPYSETTFTTTSAVRENQTAVALNTEHLQLAPGMLGGMAWLYVEVKTNANFAGFGSLYVGPVVTP